MPHGPERPWLQAAPMSPPTDPANPGRLPWSFVLRNDRTSPRARRPCHVAWASRPCQRRLVQKQKTLGRLQRPKSPCHQSRNFDLTALRRVHGLVAQLEERRNGIAEVVSSILIGSTTLPIESGSTPKFWEGVWISRGLVKPVRLAAPQIGMERFRRDTPPGQCNIASGVRMGL